MNAKKGTSGKLLTKFDIVIIAVVVILAALFLFWKGSQSGSEASSNVYKTVRYSIELTELNENAVSLIKSGDELFESVKNTSIGNVVSCEISNTKKWYDNLETGGRTWTETDKKTALITLEAACTVSDSTIATQSGAYTIKIGQKIGVSGPGYNGTGFIVAIERGEAQ